jgi:hypothetical protein
VDSVVCTTSCLILSATALKVSVTIFGGLTKPLNALSGHLSDVSCCQLIADDTFAQLRYPGSQ